jgi:two-component system sensor histidine kinase BaeS
LFIDREPELRFTITPKLLLIFLGTTGVVLLAALGLARWSFNQGFLDYVNALEQDRLTRVAADLVRLHDPADATPFAQLDLRTFMRVVHSHSPRAPGDGHRPPPPGIRPHERLLPPAGPGRPPVGLYDPGGHLIVGQAVEDGVTKKNNEVVRVPIQVTGEIVAELRSLPHRRLTTPRETQFAVAQRTATWGIAAVSLTLALVISLILAKALQRPLRRAMGRVDQIVAGDFTAHRPELRSDEFGELSANIERLATTLDEHRKARQRWLADISHELRTPVTVLMAELHALKDGVRALDAVQLESFDQEVTRLQHLIDDLYQLSLSEIGGLRYNFSTVDLSAMLEASLPDYADGGLRFERRIEPGLSLRGDATRLDQLFTNLWQNAIAYTDAPGICRCTAKRVGSRIKVMFDDSPPGVAPELLPRLFDPLFRTELSRSRKHAGAGLGLAICRNIVTAHEGTIHAAASELGGVAIHLDFPAP